MSTTLASAAARVRIKSLSDSEVHACIAAGSFVAHADEGEPNLVFVTADDVVHRGRHALLLEVEGMCPVVCFIAPGVPPFADGPQHCSSG